MSNMLLFNKLVTLVPLTGVCLLSTSAPLFSRRAELETSPYLPQDGAVWPSGPGKRGDWWIKTTVSVQDTTFWAEFKKWQKTLEPGRVYSVLLQPSSATGRKASAMHSFNITRDWDLDAQIIPLVEERVAHLEAKYNEEFLGYTDIKFKDIGAYVPPVSEKKTSPRVYPPFTIGPDPFTSPAAPPADPFLNARPAPVRGTGGMDPIAQDIISALKPAIVDLKSALVTPSRGWEKLAETFALLLNQIALPAGKVHDQSTPYGLVDPSIIDRLEALEARADRVDTRFEKMIQQMELNRQEYRDGVNTVVARMDQDRADTKDRFEAMQATLTNLINKIAPQAGKVHVQSTPSDPDDSNENGSSSPAPNGSPGPAPLGAPSTPPMGTIALPAVMPAIHAPDHFEGPLPIDQIIAADLETLQGKGGPQTPFLCAWYGTPHGLGEKYQVFDTFKRTPEAMIKEFWRSLLTHCQGCTVYFHNWAGYDSIFTLAPLLTLQPELNLKFEPIVRDGRIICLKIKDKKTRQVQLTVKDSIKLIPGALGKLAKDFGCKTLKLKFPHYFNPIDHCGSIHYKGPFPGYEFFEPKRTSKEAWEDMASKFGNNWDFMEQAKLYLRADCEALHQVLVKFFSEIYNSFHLNPINNLSIPGVAFRAWKQEMLPQIVEGVRDLSRQADPFRAAYHGGIVEVYRPHLKGEGYYYDVNSLYPTAMCRPMPTGEPKIIHLIPDGLDSFFGFLWAKVQAPADLYVGLLPIKYQGQLVCPGGSFSGFFFSEELKFALENGYKILEIGQACQFTKGYNTFEDLIKSLNQKKVEAQLAGEPVKRNIAKLLMNSLYGRFGMHPTEGVAAFVDQAGLNKIVATYTILTEIKIGDQFLIEYTSQAPAGPQINSEVTQAPKPRPMETNVPIAAAVTAYSRIIINSHKLAALALGHKLYYSDTDSLVVSGLMPDHLVDKAELGKLKLEDKLVEGIFPEVKVYWYKTTEGKTVVKCKGYHGDLTREEILSLTEGKVLELKMDRWYRFLSKGQVGINLDQPYRIDPQFRKRTKVFDSTDKWIDTRPLVLS